MKVTQITPARFHHFHLARQMEKHGLLNKIYTGYPRFQLKDEKGIPSYKLDTFPWLQAPFMKRNLLGLDKFNWLSDEWSWVKAQALDNYVAKQIKEAGVLIALSGNGLNSGKKIKELGGKYICDRGSSHVVFQNEILFEEYYKWGFKWKGTDKRIIEKELNEYEESDFITIPSDFVRNSFIEKGVSKDKLIKIPYGARLDRFKKINEPTEGKFSVLWVGQVSLRKGFMYALEAFKNFTHPNKEFIVIGNVSSEIKELLTKHNLSNVIFKGNVPNYELNDYYSSATVFLLTSLEEGLAMVQGEALSCGCPVIATPNTGSDDLISSGKDGFIVPIRDSKAVISSFENFADDPLLRAEMSENALAKVQTLGGWNKYGDSFKTLVTSFS